MRILICDDDISTIEELKKNLVRFFKRQHLAVPEIISFTNGYDLLSDSGKKDLVFLDIEMPGMNGIYVGNELKKADKNSIIFVITSYSEYLDEAMKFHVFRYLSKPLDKQRLFRNLKDAVTYYYSLSLKIPIETHHKIYTIATTDIVAIEASSRKVIVHTINDQYESIHTMQYWVQLLPKNYFFQTHRSFIVNLAHIVDFDHTVIHTILPSVTIYLTRRKYVAFKNAYLMYFESLR